MSHRKAGNDLTPRSTVCTKRDYRNTLATAACIFKDLAHLFTSRSEILLDNPSKNSAEDPGIGLGGWCYCLAVRVSSVTAEISDMRSQCYGADFAVSKGDRNNRRGSCSWDRLTSMLKDCLTSLKVSTRNQLRAKTHFGSLCPHFATTCSEESIYVSSPDDTFVQMPSVE